MTEALPLSDFERAALTAIAAEYPEREAELNGIFQQCGATERRNTGKGFFTELKCPVTLPRGFNSPLGNARFNLACLLHPFECLLFHTNGFPALLEGYAMGGEDTSGIDFLSVKFSRQPPVG